MSSIRSNLNSQDTERNRVNLIETDRPIIDFLPFAERVVSRVTRSIGLPQNRKQEFLSSGYIGLTKAQKKVSPSDTEKFKRYAAVAIRSAVVDHLREEGFYPPHTYRKIRRNLDKGAVARPLVSYLGQEVSDLPDKCPDPEESFARRQRARRVRDIVSSLPGDEREVIFTVYFEDRKLKDLACEGSQLPCLSKRHRRALSTLKKRMESASLCA